MARYGVGMVVWGSGLVAGEGAFVGDAEISVAGRPLATGRDTSCPSNGVSGRSSRGGLAGASMLALIGVDAFVGVSIAVGERVGVSTLAVGNTLPEIRNVFAGFGTTAIGVD